MRRTTYLNRATRRSRGANLALWKVTDEEGVRYRLSDGDEAQCRLCGAGARCHPCDELLTLDPPFYGEEVRCRLGGDHGVWKVIEEQMTTVLDTPVNATSQSPISLLGDPVSSRSLSAHPAISHDQVVVTQRRLADPDDPIEGSQSESSADPHSPGQGKKNALDHESHQHSRTVRYSQSP